ncbi:MAG: heat-inducible transcriptional repressor HrcA [Deltaproteobacteria bacterium]
MPDKSPNFAEMNDRTRDIFRRVVEGYLLSGEPIGSRTLSRTLNESLSAATIRNVMSDLEVLGLIGSPHISAGRVPTEMGLRMFVDGFLEVGDVPVADRQQIEAAGQSADVNGLLERVGQALSGVTGTAGLVLAPKVEAAIKHIEFVGLGGDRALVILVHTDGQVENRVITLPAGVTPSSLREATNFLNNWIAGRTIAELRQAIDAEIAADRRALDETATRLVQAGLAVWQDDSNETRLIVRGQANLLGQDLGQQDYERARLLFDELERKKDIADFLDLAEDGQGVRIFIGSENKLFSLSGSTLVVSPYVNAERKIVGAVGIIGPTRLNYGRIVPIVDYTAQLVSRLLSER